MTARATAYARSVAAEFLGGMRDGLRLLAGYWWLCLLWAACAAVFALTRV